MTTVELVPELVMFAKEHSTSDIEIHCADFYKINFEEKFDVVSYLDGFGVGTDEEQLVLLKRIHNWLKDDGCALIDIYQPLYWKKQMDKKCRFILQCENMNMIVRMLGCWTTGGKRILQMIS